MRRTQRPTRRHLRGRPPSSEPPCTETCGRSPPPRVVGARSRRRRKTTCSATNATVDQTVTVTVSQPPALAAELVRILLAALGPGRGRLRHHPRPSICRRRRACSDGAGGAGGAPVTALVAGQAALFAIHPRHARARRRLASRKQDTDCSGLRGLEQSWSRRRRRQKRRECTGADAGTQLF